MATCCGDTDERAGNIPGRYDLMTRYSGDTWTGVNFYIIINDEPLDLTGCSIRMAFRKDNKLKKVEWLLTSEADQITIDDNKISILPRLLTLDPGKYVYDLEVTFPNDFVRTFIWGNFQVERDVTPHE